MIRVTPLSTSHTLDSLLSTMRTAFYTVPTTLLLTSLLSIAFVHASGTQPTSLNPPLTFHDFADTITKGIYFIEFFSLGCDNCRAFAPTWEALVANYEMSDSVHLAQVDCSKNGGADRHSSDDIHLIVTTGLCDNNGVKEYPQLNLYRDGRLVQTYHGSRDLELLTEYLSAAFRNPYSRPMVIPKSEGKVATLTLGNLAPTLAEGPAFVWFYSQFCHTDECGLLHPIWTQLAARMRKWMTIAEVRCDAAEDPVSCAARSMRLSLVRTPTLVYYPPNGPAVTYLGPLTLAQLLAFIERGGVYPPAAMELTRETYWTMQAASVLVIAAAGTDPVESVAAHIRGIAQEWHALHGGRTVQFAWEDPKRDHLGIARVLTDDVDVLVYIVDQEVRSAFRAPYLFC